jgi:hypothetical protein
VPIAAFSPARSSVPADLSMAPYLSCGSMIDNREIRGCFDGTKCSFAQRVKQARLALKNSLNV